MKTNIIVLFISIVNLLTAQNLVLNPSFEDCSKCNRSIGHFNNNVTYWSVPTITSTDYFNYKTNKSYNHYNGYQQPRTGNALAGIYVYTDKSYREYVQGQLKQTLQKGKMYKITFYLSLAEKSTQAITDLEVLFTEEKLANCFQVNHCEKPLKPKKMTDKNFRFLKPENTSYYKNSKTWTKITIPFLANGFENFFTIGSFKSNFKTHKQRVRKASGYEFSYYYIDDVSVVALEKQIPKIEITEEDHIIEKPQPFELNKEVIFKDVLFDFNTSELLEVSLKELDILYDILNKNKTLKIEIYGHTDNVGTNKRNVILSQDRAEAVAFYLTSKGINISRIKWKGYGSSLPISDNNTEAGRHLNRRVTFKLLEN